MENTKSVDEGSQITYEQRKAMAISKGKKSLRIVCPMCLKSRPIPANINEKPLFMIDPNPEVIQVRYGLGGRKIGGFFKNDAECIRLSNLKDANVEVYHILKSEVEKLHNLFQ